MPRYRCVNTAWVETSGYSGRVHLGGGSPARWHKGHGRIAAEMIVETCRAVSQLESGRTSRCVRGCGTFACKLRGLQLRVSFHSESVGRSERSCVTATRVTRTFVYDVAIRSRCGSSPRVHTATAT